MDKHKVDISFLDHFASTQWEAILHYMVGTTMTKRPSRGVLNLLQKSDLMHARYTVISYGQRSCLRRLLTSSFLCSDSETGLHITNKGFQFLLQDVNTQVWAFLLQYLDMAEVCVNTHRRDVISLSI
jgi:transcription initiation factor TFIIH subunit 4